MWQYTCTLQHTREGDKFQPIVGTTLILTSTDANVVLETSTHLHREDGALIKHLACLFHSTLRDTFWNSKYRCNARGKRRWEGHGEREGQES